MAGFFARPARAAEDGLALKPLMAEAGVKLIVVEFFADWCEPCKAAIPQWVALQKKYRQAGLRFIVVSVNEKDLCSNPGWMPDKTICDLDGSLQKEWQAEKLPTAFLVNWQGRRLIEQGHFAQISQAVEAYFAAEPRLLIDPLRDGDGRAKDDSLRLRRLLRTQAAAFGKFSSIIDDSAPTPDAVTPIKREPRCAEPSLTPTTILRPFWRQAGSNRTLVLKAVSREGACLLAEEEAALSSLGPEKALQSAMQGVMDQLLGRKAATTVAAPGGGKSLMVWRLERQEGVDEPLIESVSGLLASEVETVSGEHVLSEKDIRLTLGNQEKFEQCAVSGTAAQGGGRSCLATVAQALGLPRSVSGDLGRVGDYWILNLRLINSRDTEIMGRVGTRIKGDKNALLEALPAAVAELFGRKAVGPAPIAASRMSVMNKAAFATFFPGLALVGVGGVGLLEMAKANADAKHHVSDAQSRHSLWKGVSAAGFAIGGAAMVSGIVLWIVDATRPPKAEASSDISVSAAVGQSGGGVILMGRW